METVSNNAGSNLDALIDEMGGDDFEDLEEEKVDKVKELPLTKNRSSLSRPLALNNSRS